MDKIPCIKCTPELWEYIKPYLKEWGYKIGEHYHKYLNTFPYVVLNNCGKFGACANYEVPNEIQFNRELVTNVEEFLERAAALKGFIYRRKDIMEINGIEIKPGMIIKTIDNVDFIAFPTKKGLSFVNYDYGGIPEIFPEEVETIRDLSSGTDIFDGKILWKKPKEIVLTMDDIAKKFGYPVERIKIAK